MEIYVSDDIYEYLTIGKRDIHSGVDDDLVVKSLEQHDKEIRKPLEEEIEMLKKENKQLIKDNRLLDKTKYTAQQDAINFFVEQEQQKVIAELEEFENEHRLRARIISEEYPTYNEEQKARVYALSSGRFEILEKLKRKLNEMKRETK